MTPNICPENAVLSSAFSPSYSTHCWSHLNIYNRFALLADASMLSFKRRKKRRGTLLHKSLNLTEASPAKQNERMPRIRERMLMTLVGIWCCCCCCCYMQAEEVFTWQISGYNINHASVWQEEYRETMNGSVKQQHLHRPALDSALDSPVHYNSSNGNIVAVHGQLF